LGTPFSDKSILLGQVIWALIAVYFLTALAWTTQHSLETFIFPRTTLEPGAIEAALTLGRYVFILIGGLIVLIGLGFDITSLAVIGGGLSVGIGFGLQKVVSNFISGVILLFEQPLRPGDSVEVAGVAGTVEKLDVRTTVLRRSSDNMIIIIPNETLFTSSIVNTTRNIQATKLLIEVGASYTSDPDEVMRLLRNVCAEYELVAKSPAPGITFKGYGESSLDFEVAVWVEKKEHRSQVPTELRVRILREFQKCGIEMPYLQQDIHIHGSLPGPALNQGSESVAGLSGG
jgi:small-conductance mechanosensitive channel